jgi:PBP1b-binding outer membrane lipoprotein LpoB
MFVTCLHEFYLYNVSVIVKKETKRKAQYMRLIKFLSLLVLIFLFLAGCSGESSSDSTPTEKPVEPTKEVVVDPTDTPTVEPTDVRPTPTETESTIDEVEGEEVVEEPVEVAMVNDACLDCHVDKQRLIDTAKPEEEVEIENVGEG